MKISSAVVGTLAGVLVAPIALLTAIASAGGGHGHYLAARLWFPFTMVSTYFLDSITPPFIVLAVLQYPAYGWIAGRAVSHQKTRTALLMILVLHVGIALMLCLKPPLDFH